jgi:ATP-dependent DNA helicase UvrD/PcrA
MPGPAGGVSSETHSEGVHSEGGRATAAARGCRAHRALSYTNVAVEEIAAAAESAGAPVTEPDFLGTLHRVLLRYVVRPFGMKCMGCDAPPRLIADPPTRNETVSFRDGWAQRAVSIWDLHYRADSSFVLGADADVLHETTLDATQIAANAQRGARKLKQDLAAQGLMSLSDAMYWAQRALEDVECARAVAARFDELVVDEAQDTMDTQVRCLELLKAAGHGPWWSSATPTRRSTASPAPRNRG